MIFSKYTGLSIFVVGLVFPGFVVADVYKYVAPDGSVYYTDEPRDKRFKLIIRSKPRNYSVALKRFRENKKKFSPLISSIAEKYDFDENLIHAIIRAESAYDPHAISSAGAVGMMQLMPQTAKRYGVTDRKDPHQNIEGGVRYMIYLLELFDSDLKLAVAAYNAGEGAVLKYKRTIPPYPETRNYVKQVLTFYNKMG